MLKIMNIMNVVFGLVYGELAYIGLQSVIKFKFNHSDVLAIKVGTFFMGYLFSIFTSDVWFIVFPVIVLLTLALKIRN